MFITSIPIVLSYTSLFNLIEFILFLATIAGLLYFYTPANNPIWEENLGDGWYTLLRNMWLGDAALWRAFWPFFIFANVVFAYIDYRANSVSYTIASWKTVHGMLFLPMVWWATAVWRCSVNSSNKLWAVAARSLVIYFFLDVILRLFIAIKFPQALFDCHLLVMEYGDCW